MTTPPKDPAFRNEADYAQMRQVLHQAYFTQQGIPTAFGIPSVESFRLFPRPTMAAMTSRGRPIDALARLFLMNEPVEAKALEQALAPMSVQSWVEAGIIGLQGELAFPMMGIALFEGLHLLHDTKMEVGPTYVMGVAGTTAALAAQAIFAKGELALDLGTGCGVLAFLAARHCTRVLATDMNPRAIAMARFNARLNGIVNVDFAVGDLYEPVREYVKSGSRLQTSPALADSGTPSARAEGDRREERDLATFDFIYCNPPFVITPSPGYMYRDSGLVGDAIVEKVARGAGPLLREGGIAQFVCNWMHVANEPWQQRLAGWLAGSACDALIFQTRTVTPLDYASIWIEETEKSATPEARWKMLNEWLEAYQRMGLQGVSFGMFTMRKRPPRLVETAGENWVAFDDVPETLATPTGPHIADMLGCREFLRQAGAGAEGDARIADSVIACSTHLRVVRTLKPGGGAGLAALGTTIGGGTAGAASTPGGEWKFERDEVRLARGYPFAKVVDQRQTELIMALDGSRTVRQVVEALAASSKVPAAGLLPVVVRLCRQLLERAYVVPVRK